MEYVMYGKLLTHLRDQRSKQTSLFHFTEEVNIIDLMKLTKKKKRILIFNLNYSESFQDLQQPSEDSSITAKDLTKYAYGVAKGMEFIVSKNVRIF